MITRQTSSMVLMIVVCLMIVPTVSAGLLDPSIVGPIIVDEQIGDDIIDPEIYNETARRLENITLSEIDITAEEAVEEARSFLATLFWFSVKMATMFAGVMMVCRKEANAIHVVSGLFTAFFVVFVFPGVLDSLMA